MKLVKLAESVSNINRQLKAMSVSEYAVFTEIDKIHRLLMTGENYISVHSDIAWKTEREIADMHYSKSYDKMTVQNGVNQACEMCSGYDHGSLRYCSECGEELPTEFIPATDTEPEYYRFGDCEFCASLEGRDNTFEEF